MTNTMYTYLIKLRLSEAKYGRLMWLLKELSRTCGSDFSYDIKSFHRHVTFFGFVRDGVSLRLEYTCPERAHNIVWDYILDLVKERV